MSLVCGLLVGFFLEKVEIVDVLVTSLLVDL